LKVAVGCVSEPDIACYRVLAGVVDGGVIPIAEVVINYDCACVAARTDGDKGGVVLEVTFVTPELIWWWRRSVSTGWIVCCAAICFPEVGKLGGSDVLDAIIVVQVDDCHVNVVR